MLWLTIIRKTTDDQIDDDYEKQLIDRRISLGVAKLKGTIRILPDIIGVQHIFQRENGNDQNSMLNL